LVAGSASNFAGSADSILMCYQKPSITVPLLHKPLKPTVSLDVVSLVANSYGYYSLKSSNALRSNSRCTWRHSEGSRNVHNTVIRHALSPLRSCGSVTAYVHGCARRVAPSRHPIAIRDTPVAHTGGETPQSSHNATGCAACPSLLFSPPGNGFSTLDVRWKLLI